MTGRIVRDIVDALGRDPHILVVDDEHDVLEVVATAFQHAGFKVTPMSCTYAAAETLGECDPYDIILSDINNRGQRTDTKGGFTLYKRAHDIGKQPLLYAVMSGEDHYQRDPLMEHIDLFLPKPFTLRELRERLIITYYKKLSSRN